MISIEPVTLKPPLPAVAVSLKGDPAQRGDLLEAQLDLALHAGLDSLEDHLGVVLVQLGLRVEAERPLEIQDGAQLPELLELLLDQGQVDLDLAQLAVRAELQGELGPAEVAEVLGVELQLGLNLGTLGTDRHGGGVLVLLVALVRGLRREAAGDLDVLGRPLEDRLAVGLVQARDELAPLGVERGPRGEDRHDGALVLAGHVPGELIELAPALQPGHDLEQGAHVHVPEHGQVEAQVAA